jgi:outer membrane protein insertion porin family
MIRSRLVATAALFSCASAFAAGTSGSTATEKLDRVEIDGVTSFSQAEIEGALEIGPGDFVDRGKILKTTENLSNLYHTRGFQSAQVNEQVVQKHEHGVTSTILEFQVKEGKATLVSGVQLHLIQEEDPVLKKYWDKIEPELERRIAILPGDRLDQEKIANARRSIQESLNSQEFIGAKVEEIRTNEGTPPTGFTKKPDVEKWDNVEFRVDLGDRVTFGFRGNQSIPASGLDALIAEAKVIGLGKDYVDVIRSRFEDEYKSLGFAHVTIQSCPIERPERHERHITYVIDEGSRVTIENVKFDGNLVFTNEDLTDQFLSKGSEALQSGYYVEKDLQKAAQFLIEWMKSRGYLAAKLITISHAFVLKPRKMDSEKTADVTVYLYEGEQTIVRKTELIGNQAISSNEVKKILGVSENQPLNLYAFNEGLENLKTAYRNKGYLAVRIANENTDSVVQYAEQNRAADISLEIVEGPKYKVGTVSVEGLVATKEYVVRRELLLKEGEVLEETKLTGSEARLHRLGIFSVITIRATDDPEHEDVKNVKISVQEGTPGLIAGGAGIRNDLGLRVFSQVGYQNLWGENHTLGLSLAANHRFENFNFVEYEAQLAYVWPWFFLGETTFRPTATLTGTQYIDFNAVTAQLALTWDHKLIRKPDLTGLFTYSLERIIQFGAANATDNQGLRIGSITPSLRLDMRDNPLNPSSGFFMNTSYEISSPYLLSQHDPFPIGYSIFLLRGDYYLPVYKGITWYSSFRTGYERSTESQVVNPGTGQVIAESGQIPLIKQFALGGIGSLRGFQDQELNLYTYNIFQASFVDYRTELDFPFAGALKIGGFLDAANLLSPGVTDVAYSFTRYLNYGAGFALRYQTPVGPVNLDWGFKLNPLPSTQTQQFYFSIGVI